ncbi:hypothetical protein L1987_47064 [Smallanthus sonchifolius]|uniref:Uncharacterized protein n=1 Tax=Smallanthus sonchifolius TaxID=185202 RepID=A0ACB9G2K9_9ASTR|nr:hypothetical protein L1987_47064 [Smallanthus sonchifolius]
MNSRLHSSSTVFALMVIAIAMCFPVECQETRLQLMANNDECDQCIRSNGQCGSNSASPELFACFCATGNFSLTCNDSNESEGGSNGTVTKTESNETTVITGSNATMTIIGSNGTTTITRSNGTTTITRFNATTTETGFNGTTTETGSNGTTTETGSNGTTTKTGSSGTTRKLVIGTPGYMAPEVFLRNRGGGGASHKSDVYSYGMMLLEMTGAHGHNNTRGTSTSEGYFPDWIYKLVEVEGDLGDYGMKTKTKEEEELARKMMVVSLWCIQLDQSIRPSIGKIVEMLEGSFESLQVPPRHFESSPARFTQGVSQLDTLSSTS